MSGIDQTRQAIVGINVDRDHQIEPQQRQVSEVVLRQTFATQMCVHATKSAKTIDGDANAFEVGQFDAPVVADHHVFDVAAAIDQRADLSPGFVGQFGQLPRKFRRHDLVRSDSPGVELFDPAKLIWLEARGVSDYVFDSSFPPFTRSSNARSETDKFAERLR